MILDAIRARHPEITVIGTAGPGHGGRDWEAGWKLADAIKLPLIDEHYYEKPEWFLDNLDRYDHFDRARSLVYVGEYAAHERDRKSTLRSALVEAAYLTGLERNADIVRMASYAPLLGKLGDTQWDPNLIYFTSTAVSPTINYYVQQLFGQNGGDRYLPSAVGPELPARELAVSAVRDSSTGDLILKLVHLGDAPRALTIRLEGASAIAPQATATVLAGPLQAVNRLDAPDNLVPVSRALAVSPTFDHELPAHSLTVLRFQTR
jgi:alpha-L-arabinofuranosidase